MKSLHPQRPHHLIDRSYIELISFIVLPQSLFSYMYIGSFTIINAIHVVHLNRVYDEAKFTGGCGKPILIYHMIDRLSLISQFNDKQKVKDNI